MSSVVGICFCIPLITFSLLLRDPTLGTEQSLPDAEEDSTTTTETGKFWKWR
jgi:hypothetical protein